MSATAKAQAVLSLLIYLPQPRSHVIEMKH
jgi:hypothetical protein